MQGGLFGLGRTQQAYLYVSQLIPTLLAIFEPDLTLTMLGVQVFYVLSSIVYIKYLSIEKNHYPYIMNELSRLREQIHKGMVLGISAFLLIMVYGIIFIKIGKVALPDKVDLGTHFQDELWGFLLLCLINPVLQQWFWRLFLPKTSQESYYRSHIMNISYLLFHFALFSKYVGVFRAVPLVGTFFSVGRSMSHIKNKYGIVSSIVTHYGISLGGFGLYVYLNLATNMFQKN